MGAAKTASRQRAEEIKKQALAKQRRQSAAIYTGLAVLVLGMIALAFVGIRNASESNPKNADLETVSGLGGASAPPWQLPTDAPGRVEAAGLNLGPMGTADHYHAHLDIIVDGEPVPVPENIGIDPNNGAMSAVHTHTSDGIIHIEAARKGQTFSLGQLFTQWNVRLTDDQIGALKAQDGTTLKAFVDGKEVGNPAMIRLSERQQIALVYGPADSPVKPPADFPENL